MAKLVMERKSSDNKYLHKTFHVSLNRGIGVVGDKYGREGVCEYLTDYVHTFFHPMTLSEINDYLLGIYAAEECPERIKTELTDSSLSVSITSCPAIETIHAKGVTLSRWYDETTKTVYRVLAELSGLVFRLDFYDGETGEARYAFTKA